MLNFRRDSRSDGPPSTDVRGSIHNLQLDIMDDIVPTRKARMKLWNTSSEKVCEVQTVDENGPSSPMRYSNSRRFSDFVGAGSSLGTGTCALPTIQSFRRASENPCLISPSAIGGTKPKTSQKSGFFSTNNLLSSLTSSAIEINKCEEPPPSKNFSKAGTSAGTSNFLEVGGATNRSHRSNSFDVSFLHKVDPQPSGSGQDDKNSMLTGWFAKRHQPISAKKNTTKRGSHCSVSFTKDVLDRLKEKDSKENKKTQKESRDPIRKFLCDGKKAIIDAHILGNTIEGFLKRDSNSGKSTAKESARSKKSNFISPSNWFGRSDEVDSTDKCDSSLCSTLKDLFVK